MVKGWNLVASKQFWFHTLGHQSMNDVFQFSPLKLIIRNILRSIISWRYWTWKSAKPFCLLALGQCWTQTHYFFLKKDIKHPSLKQKTPTETKGTSQPIWLRHALGKMHPNAGGFTFHWIFFSVFSQITLSHSANGNSMMIPSPYNQFWVTFPSSPALLPLKNPNPQVSTTLVRLWVKFPNPRAQLCSRRQAGNKPYHSH